MIELLLQAERELAVGMVDQAERLYRQAVEADPRNSIAVVGLARVALERGDEPEAWRLAGEALAIDPENVAAQRLAERLAEVWSYRGESIADAAAARAPADTPLEPKALAPELPEATPEPPPAASPAPSSSEESRGLLDRLLGRNRP